MLALAALACAAGVALGEWQSRRAEEKRALAAQFDHAVNSAPVGIGATPVRAADIVGKRVVADGAFAAERTVFLDNRNRGGRPGYEVVTPLWLSPSTGVLVQRGWVARSQREKVRTPPGVQHIDGIALAHLPKALSTGNAESGSIRQNLDIEAYAREIGLALQPIVIQQRSENGDGLVRDWLRPDFGIDTHRAYALQWYSLGALAAVLGAVFSFRRAGQS